MSPREVEQILDLAEDMTSMLAELLAMVRKEMQPAEAAARPGDQAARLQSALDYANRWKGSETAPSSGGHLRLVE